MNDNVAIQFITIWKKKFDKVRRILSRLPNEVAKEALAFTIENFNKQQTPDQKKWASRKDNKNSRALLVRTGRLRKSIRISIANSEQIKIGTDLSYAKYLQQGTPKMTARPFIGSSPILIRRLRRFIERKVNGAINP